MAPLQVLVDTGAAAHFIDEVTARNAGFILEPLEVPMTFRGVDGRPLEHGPATHMVRATVSLQQPLGGRPDPSCAHCSMLNMAVITSPTFPAIIGMPWLRASKATISFAGDNISFPPDLACSGACGGPPPPTPPLLAGAAALAKDTGAPSPSVVSPMIGPIPGPAEEAPQPLPKEESTGNRLDVQLPAHLAEFRDVFSKSKAATLPPHRPYDCSIDLVPGAEAPFSPIYSLTERERKELLKQTQDLLKQGFIRASTSPAGAPVMFVPKKEGELRMCMDYRRLNMVTIKDRTPLPLISDVLERVRGAKWFTKLDLRHAYHRVRIRKGDEWKTAFRTFVGHFEWLVMPFGLCNAPATFQRFLNDVMRDLLDRGVLVYLDDILIYADTREEHDRLVREVLTRLRANALFVSLNKCAFGVTRVEYLGHILTTDGVEMDPEKVKSILNWPTPTSIKDLQQFLGLANYYRRFIPAFSSAARPLHDLQKKSAGWRWTETEANAFATLQHAFAEMVALAHADPSRPFVVETDASDFAVGCVLSQRDAQGHLRPLAFHSRSLNPAEANYPILDKELLAIITAFKVWRHHLEGAHERVVVLTDHRNLEHLGSLPVTTGRHARWSLFLSRFDFVLTFTSGASNARADALSRRPDYRVAAAPERGHPIVPPSALIAAVPAANGDEDGDEDDDTGWLTLAPSRGPPLDEALTKSIRAALDTDPLFAAYRAAPERFPRLSLDDDGLLKDGHWRYVPEGASRVMVLQRAHDSRIGGHFGVTRTLHQLQRRYWWPGMRNTIADYTRTCMVCARIKVPRQRPHGRLQPLDTPKVPWSSISLDFITDLPPSNGHTCILVVVDRLTKMAHLLPFASIPSAEATATSLITTVVRHHGLPSDIVSDRGPQFTSQLWSSLCKGLGIKAKLSTAYHPQTDGQTERVNQVLELYLSCYLTYQQDNWLELLPFAEMSINDAVNASTGMSPYYANYGFHPRFSTEPLQHDALPASMPLVSHIAAVQQTLRSQLEEAKRAYKRFADAHRRDAPKFQVGDQVMLRLTNMPTTQPARKLAFRYAGPFTIKRVIRDTAVELDLPAEYAQRHPVFHVSLVKPWSASDEEQFPGRVVPPPPPIELEDEQWFRVEAILDSRWHRRNFQYRVRWLGYDAKDDTWESAVDLRHNPLAAQFHARYPDKPRPDSPPPQSRRAPTATAAAARPLRGA